jgi:uncharacterized SAM-binding protein YcdF (DUF218 family)
MSQDKGFLMDQTVEIVKQFFLPGSIPFLMFGLVIGVALLYLRGEAKNWGKRWLTTLVILYGLISTPWIARMLETILSQGYQTPIEVRQFQDLNAIVVLGGGSSSMQVAEQRLEVLSAATILRVWEGARLFHALNSPWMIVSGGANSQVGVTIPESIPMQDLLIDLGVPEEQILLDTLSGNTYEQSVNLKRLLQAKDIRRFALVTSPTHMRRAMAAFKAQGLDPLPAPSRQHSDGHLSHQIAFLPNDVALEVSLRTIREIMASIYYALRGWLTPTTASSNPASIL